MKRIKISLPNSGRLPALAITMILCLSFGAHSRMEVPGALPRIVEAKPTQETKTLSAPVNEVAENMQVLSPEDASLYRAIFLAQFKGDWKAADQLITELDDTGLLGHVLADRYKRQATKVEDLQAWLVAYPDLPQAAAIYQQIRHIPAVKASLEKEDFTAPWDSGDVSGNPEAFKVANQPKAKTDKKAQAFKGKFDQALRKGNPFAAKALLETEQKRQTIPSPEKAKAMGKIAASLFYQGQTEAARKQAGEAAQRNNPLALWIYGLSSWKQGDSRTAANSFTKLATLKGLSTWDRTAAQFWAYRSLKRNGDIAEAHAWLEKAAHHPHSFYGIMAAHLLSRAGEESWELPVLNVDHVDTLKDRPAGWRALALLQIGQKSMAEKELRHLNPQGDRNLQESMLALAEATHMPSLTVQLGGVATNYKGRYYNAALYPLPPWQPEKGFEIDRALMFALMRHESQFDPTAVSSRGACGLMQIMPTTANYVADDNITDDECSSRLMEPSYNMALGQKYVRYLAKHPSVGDNLLLLLAAYNSGPNKLSRWGDAKTRKDPLLFIESLPVRETREYVQQVLIYYWNYRARLLEPETSLTQLAHGEWPNYNLYEESRPRSRTKQVRAGGSVDMANESNPL